MAVKTLSWFKLWNSIYSCVFFCFEKSLKDFTLYSPILLTLWFSYLQIPIKESCMYVSCHSFFKTPHKSLKFQQTLLLLHIKKKYKQTWQNESILKWYSWKKINVYQQCTSCASAVRKSVGNTFSGNLET